MDDLDRDLEKRAGMARWWEETSLGFFYFIRCACGAAYEAVYRDEAEGDALRLAEDRALRRFHDSFPGCPHLARYETLRRDPEFALLLASRAVTRAQQDSDLLWG